MVTSIPILGFVPGSVVGPVLITLGMVIGLNQDLKDKALLVQKIDEINAQFDALHT